MAKAFDYGEKRPDGQYERHPTLAGSTWPKVYVRPVRRSYRHVGPRAPGPLRDLTSEEQARYATSGYVKFETYPESEHSVTGRFWTQAELNRVGQCGAVTTMGQALAETYAQQPGFYGKTFCATCHDYFAVGEAGEFIWDGTTERVGT